MISAPSHEAIAARAYAYWEGRGCPIGTPEVDWLLAEEQVSIAREAVAEDMTS